MREFYDYVFTCFRITDKIVEEIDISNFNFNSATVLTQNNTEIELT